MKRDILLGSYGWRHAHWSETFYPQELPDSEGDDWRLGYYSNEFNTVMVPASYWYDIGATPDLCSTWLEDVNEQFRFLIECRSDMFRTRNQGSISIEVFRDCLQVLRSQTTAIMFLHHAPYATESVKQFEQLADSLGLEMYSGHDVVTESACHQMKNVWVPGSRLSSDIALIENDLSDMRQMRRVIEEFDTCHADECDRSSMIIKHADLKASKLSDLRSVLEIMGY